MFIIDLLRLWRDKNRTQIPKDGLAPVWDEYCQRGYRNILQLRCFQDFYKKVGEILIPQPEGIVLDGGCGTGGLFELVLSTVEPSRVVAADFSSAMLGEARSEAGRLLGPDNGAFEFRQVDFTYQLPWPDNTFDAVVFNLLICYLPVGKWQEVTLPEAYRVLKPGGYFYVTTNLRGWDFRKDLRKRLVPEILSSPRKAVKATSVIPSTNKLNVLVERGVVVYPRRGEVVTEGQRIGFINFATAEAFEGGVEIIRAQKPPSTTVERGFLFC